jgi:predicted RNase H-like HicB family nuclease
MKTTKMKALVWKEGKYHVAQLLNVDVSSFGESKREAMANLREAAELFFEDSTEKEIRSVVSPEIVTTDIVHA